MMTMNHIDWVDWQQWKANTLKFLEEGKNTLLNFKTVTEFVWDSSLTYDWLESCKMGNSKKIQIWLLHTDLFLFHNLPSYIVIQ